MTALQSKLNLLRAQKEAILNSGLFSEEEIKSLTPNLDKHIKDAERKLEISARDYEVKGTHEIPTYNGASKQTKF